MSTETSPLAARVTRSVTVLNRTADAPLFERGANRLAREVLGVGEDPALTHDERDLLTSQGAPGISHLAGDDAAPDDDQAARDRLRAGRVPARPDAGGLDARDGRDRRAAAGADRDRVAGGERELGALGRGHDDPALPGRAGRCLVARSMWWPSSHCTCPSSFQWDVNVSRRRSTAALSMVPVTA